MTESANRTRKALAIAEVLTVAGCSVEDAQELPSVAWERAAQLAAHWKGTRWVDASYQTRSAVIAILQERETTDAFEGFPDA